MVIGRAIGTLLDMRNYFYLTALVGATGVAAGAFGAHALKETLVAHGTLSTWQTAVLYHLIHAPALLAASLYRADKPAGLGWLAQACACWGGGVGLFSGSLYGLALGGPRWLGPITPLGGVLLIAGWLFVLRGATKPPRSPLN